jgi:pimeloyl-ACP methyl ester carboxylesterase
MQRSDLDKSKILAAAWSIGAGVATDLAARKPVAGLMTFSAFTSMPDMGEILTPWLPVRMICKHHFDNATKFKTIKCPIFCVHGQADTMIPCTMTKSLAQSAGVEPLLIPGANHNDLFEVGESTITPALREFLKRY